VPDAGLPGRGGGDVDAALTESNPAAAAGARFFCRVPEGPGPPRCPPAEEMEGRLRPCKRSNPPFRSTLARTAVLFVTSSGGAQKPIRHDFSPCSAKKHGSDRRPKTRKVWDVGGGVREKKSGPGNWTEGVRKGDIKRRKKSFGDRTKKRAGPGRTLAPQDHCTELFAGGAALRRVARRGNGPPRWNAPSPSFSDGVLEHIVDPPGFLSSLHGNRRPRADAVWVILGGPNYAVWYNRMADALSGRFRVKYKRSTPGSGLTLRSHPTVRFSTRASSIRKAPRITGAGYAWVGTTLMGTPSSIVQSAGPPLLREFFKGQDGGERQSPRALTEAAPYTALRRNFVEATEERAAPCAACWPELLGLPDVRSPGRRLRARSMPVSSGRRAGRLGRIFRGGLASPTSSQLPVPGWAGQTEYAVALSSRFLSTSAPTARHEKLSWRRRPPRFASRHVGGPLLEKASRPPAPPGKGDWSSLKTTDRLARAELFRAFACVCHRPLDGSFRAGRHGPIRSRAPVCGREEARVSPGPRPGTGRYEP